MRRFSRPLLLAIALLGVGGPTGFGQPSPPADDPDSNPVLTDRKPFCEALSRKVVILQRTVTAPHAEADWLASEGNRMCAIGYFRPGIRRLRWALIELTEMEDGH